MERISRRDFLQILGGVAAHAVSEAFVVRKNPAAKEIPSNLVLILQEYSNRIAPRIRFPGWENNYQLRVLRPNPEAFAHASLLLAFYDGGINQLINCVKFLENHDLEVNVFGMEVSLLERIFPRQERGRFIPSFEEGKPIKIELRFRDVIQNYLPERADFQAADYTIIHELYHLVQLARDPGYHYMSKWNVGTALTIGATTLIARPILKIFIENYPAGPSDLRFNRRSLLEKLFPTLLAGLAGLAIDRRFGIIERQTYFQAERLSEYPSFEGIKGKFFLSEDSKNR